jgi:hydrogenase expression/formation protein HypD
VKFVDEFRDPDLARKIAGELAAAVTRPWRVMEVCGGQTHAIVRFGVDRLLPEGVELLHGPGCPVCVTPRGLLDQALELAARPGVVLASFGDMLRVPGSQGDLLSVKARGGDVRAVYSPLDAVTLAEKEPDKQVVFLAVGFETTAPAHAAAVQEAARRGLENFSLLVSHVLVPPALEALLSDPDCQVDAFLAAGHVCAVMGVAEYQPLVERYQVPIVVTGFEPLDLLEGVLRVVRQLEDGRAELENQYARVVREDGNPAARRAVEEVFEVAPQRWRGIGEIPSSGLRLREQYAAYDAARRFDLGEPEDAEDPACRSGEVLQGRLKPPDCEVYGTRCTPRTPLGPTMVSGEGACAAYYRYRREAV